MNSINLSSLRTRPTADICDDVEATLVLMADYRSYGAIDRCGGPAETIVTTDDNTLVKAALQEPGDDRVLFVDNGGSMRCALLGGDLAGLAARNGWAGVVVHGAVRDSDEIRDTPIAVFALGTCPRKSEKQGRGERGVTLNVADAVIQPGHLVAADRDGIVVVDPALLAP